VTDILGSQDHGTFGKSLPSGNPQCTSLCIIAFVLPSNALTKTVPHDVVHHHTML
jgi:hypothetical protein